MKENTDNMPMKHLIAIGIVLWVAVYIISKMVL